MIECKVCNASIVNRRGLSTHLRKHKLTSKKYYETYEPKHCAICFKKIRYKRSQLRLVPYWKRKFCSRTCKPKDSASPNWKGGIQKVNGYVLVQLKALPQTEQQQLSRMFSRKDGKSWVSQHRLVMAKSLGRPLTSFETVHHKNGIRDDNRLENLELWEGKHPPGIRSGDIECPSCGHHFTRTKYA